MQLETALSPLTLLLMTVLMTAAGLLVRRFYWRTLPPVGAMARRGLILLRLTSILMVSLLLIRPVLIRSDSSSDQARLLVVLEDSGSLQQDDAPGGLTRWDAAVGMAQMVDSLLIEADLPLETVFLRGNGLTQPATFNPSASQFPPTAIGTDLDALIREAVDYGDASLVRGLLLMSDGNESPGLQPRSALNSPGAYAGLLIGLGGDGDVFDVGLRDLHYPGSAFVGDEVVIQAVAEITGKGPASVRCLLMRNAEIIAEKQLDLQADQSIVRTELSYIPTVAGMDQLELILESRDDERRPENNRASLAIDVFRENAKLLYLAGSAGWNTRFLAQAAAREPRVELQTRVLGPSGMQVAGDEAIQVPATVSDWSAYDGILIDTQAAARLADAGRGLADAVAAGLGVIILESTGEVRLPEALTALLPGRRPTVYSGASRLAFAPQGLDHAILSMPERTSGLTGPSGLSGLLGPPLDRVVWLDPAAGATVLLEARVPGQGSFAYPVLIAGSHQQGRVIWCGANELWRTVFWQNLRAEDSAGSTLAAMLRNMLVWTSLGDRHTGVFFADSKRVYAEGETIALEARRQDMRGRALAEELVIEVSRLDDREAAAPLRVRMRPDPARSGIMQSTLPPLPPGRYGIHALEEAFAETPAADLQLLVVPSTLEGAQVRLDRLNLTALAREHAFGYMDQTTPDLAGKLSRFLDSLDASPVQRTRLTVDRILDGWPLLVLTIFLLGLEWLYRRRLGMI